MNKNLLQQVLDYEENKSSYNKKDKEELKKSLLKSISIKLNKFGSLFIDSIDELNR